MREWWRSLRVTYFTVDTRSLGVFRVLFGFVLLSDLARRWVELPFWYANSGLLPNHTLLWRPPASHMFSLFFAASNVHEAQLGFALCGAAYLLFLLGYRSGVAQVLALVARVSLNSRLAVLENGGDMVMDLLCLLTLPLPLGARFSLDALVVSQKRESTSVEDARAADEAWALARRPVESLAVLGLLLQFATIYLFNAAAKNGEAWRDGTAVHYALHQDKLVTFAGVWLREHLPLNVLHVLTWSVLTTEWVGFSLIVTPLFVREARLVAVCVMPLLHLGFALGLNLGGFSPAMMSFYPLLLSAQHWDALSRRFGPRFRLARARLQNALLPLLGRLPLVGVRPAGKLRRAFTEGAVVMLLLAIASEVVNDNTPVPMALRVHQPAWAHAVIEYPRILQGWRMFASEPSRSDSMIYVDATTAAGARVDPYNEVASVQHFPAGDVVPSHMGQSQFFVMYSDRIPMKDYAAYRQAFAEWLEAYPERTGRREDCLLKYDVYYVSDQSPAPGADPKPTPLGRQRFMTYRAPSDGNCQPLPHSEPSKPVAAR